jgi:hypothetical protein
MQVYNEGRLHLREDGSTYFVGQPVMIRFKKLSDLDNGNASLSTTNPNETSISATSSKNGSSISYKRYVQNKQA